jgi:rod shape-determining protein MreC
LRLLAYLALAVTLVVLDHRGGWIHQLRRQAGAVAEPLRAAAGLPSTVVGGVGDYVGTAAQLARENRQLRQDLLVAQARMARMSTIAADNARLRVMLDAAQRAQLDVQLAPILDVDLDPVRQRLVLDAGRGDGVRVGQSVIDARGLLGQVTHVGPLQSDVLLITDPDHAVPVSVARNGVRLVAYGTGRSDRLTLESVPLSSDVKVGDVIVTSGMGARFPPGFPVGRIVRLEPDESRAFLRGDVQPAAQIDRGREVLLLRAAPARPPVAIQTPLPPAPVGGAGAVPASPGATRATAAGLVGGMPAQGAAAPPAVPDARAMPSPASAATSTNATPPRTPPVTANGATPVPANDPAAGTSNRMPAPAGRAMPGAVQSAPSTPPSGGGTR